MFQITVLVVTMPSSNIPCKKNQTWESSIAVFEAYLGAKITNIHRHLLPKKIPMNQDWKILDRTKKFQLLYGLRPRI